ncbi:uncharacterized protein LOC132588902 [Heteronotia binoei]|uniref:uncharacterized protein LOC132588902 n=1 Tax=Heteronotia binoei TaxID=13085 RepID=UPI002930BC43|nr:uncharacterized protein LOC132588902 [Heteronotia binoei]
MRALVTMIATPLKNPGVSDCLRSSPRREPARLKSVCLDSIPRGTPLKHLAKFQAVSVSAVREAALSCPMGLGEDRQKRDVFQSTVLSTATCAKGFPDISEIKPVFGDELGQLAFRPKEGAMLKKALLKRKACEPLPLGSPAKSSPRTEPRMVLANRQNQLPGRELGDTQSTTDFILTPDRHLNLLERRDKKNGAGSMQEEGPFKKPLGVARVSQPVGLARNRTWSLAAVDPLVLESPHKFFSRMKQMAAPRPQQQGSSGQAYSSPHQTKQNGPNSAAVKPPVTVEQLNNHHEEDPEATCSQDDAFLLEAAELEDDTFNVDATDVTYGPDTHSPLAGRPQEERALQEGSQEPGQNGGQESMAEPQSPSQDFYDILATPKIHIPRKRKPAGADSKAPLGVPRVDTTYNHTPEEVQQRILLSEWRIRVLNDTAVFLEGKRREMNNIYWHSNAIVERVARSQVKTSSGNIYVLEGRIDAATMKKEGMPAKFITKFARGIPKNWKAYVHDLLRSLKRKGQSSKRAKRTSDSYEDNHGTEDSVQTAGAVEEAPPPDIRTKRGTKTSTYEVLRLSSRSSSERRQVPPSQPDPNASFTRSGRQVKPLLQYWCGERIVVDQELNVTVTRGGHQLLDSTKLSLPPRDQLSFLEMCPPPANQHLSHVDPVGLLVCLGLKIVNSARPQRKKNSCSPENGEVSANAAEETPLCHQTKGGASKRSTRSPQKVAGPGSKKKPLHFVSDSDENEELSPEDLCRRKAVVPLTPLNFKNLSEKGIWPQRKPAEQQVVKEGREMSACRKKQELSLEDLCRTKTVVPLTPLNFKQLPEKGVWPQRKPAEQQVVKEGREMSACRKKQEISPEDLCRTKTVVPLTPLNFKQLPEKGGWPQRKPAEQQVPKEGRETDDCRMSPDRELTPARHAQRLQKQPRQHECGARSSSAEDDESSDDSPRIRRKAQPSFRRRTPQLTSVSDPKQQSAVKKAPSVPERTKGPPGSCAQSRAARAVPSPPNEQPESPSPPSLANGSPGAQRWSRGSRKCRKYVFESESESEPSPGDSEGSKGKAKAAAARRGGGAGPSRAKGTAPAGRRPKETPHQDADGSEVWLEEELQDLHRQGGAPQGGHYYGSSTARASLG